MGILVSISGMYLRSHGGEDPIGGHVPIPNQEQPSESIHDQKGTNDNGTDDDQLDDQAVPHSTSTNTTPPPPPNGNPLCKAFALENLRSLLAACMVPMLWSGGFYLSFIWMAIYMNDLTDNPVPHAFGVNAGALLLSVCLFFPLAGIMSDWFGRKRIMTIGGASLGILSPVMIVLIGRGNALLALFSQTVLGVTLSLFGAPMVGYSF